MIVRRLAGGAVGTACAILATLLSVATAGSAAAAGAATEGFRPLATVNGDTISSEDLARELGVMVARAPAGIAFDAPEPETVLRRLIQNELLIQEGYRMGLQDQFAVKNGRIEAVRSRWMRTLLDSIAGQIPAGDLERAELVERRRLHVADYLAMLARTHGASVDTALLRSLDYASADAAVKERLRSSTEVLAHLPNGTITVEGLSREIRFIAFHGLEGKPDAAARRDRIFFEILNERLLVLEAWRSGLDRRPDMLRYERGVERGLVLEEAVNVLVKFDFAPTEQEIEAFYRDHLDAVTPAPRIRMESIKLSSKQTAAELRERALEGGRLSWLAKAVPGVVEGPPPFPNEFFAPEQLGIAPETVELGLIPEPYGVPGGWVVARIVEIEQVAPAPLAECRNDILRMMKSQATQDHMTTILATLEAASEVVVLDGAYAEVARLTDLAVASRRAELEEQEAAAKAE